MKLSVYILGHEVAVLESVGDFKSVLTYLPDTEPDNFVSLTMPVRTESYVWDDQLPPVFQMNLPEGYLLQVLQVQFGPHIGASPLALLSVIGRNMVGRTQVAAPGAQLNELPKPVEIAELLQGDNSEQASSVARARAKRSACNGSPGRAIRSCHMVLRMTVRPIQAGSSRRRQGPIPVVEPVRPVIEAWKHFTSDASPEALMFPTFGRGKRKGQLVPHSSKNFLRVRIRPGGWVFRIVLSRFR